MVDTFYFALDNEVDLASFDFSLYIEGFLSGFFGVDLIFYSIKFFGAYWFSWRHSLEESRISLFSNGWTQPNSIKI